MTNIIRKPPGLYFHGAPASRVELIDKEGYIKPAPPAAFKGTRDEIGLVWVTDDISVALHHAIGYEGKGTIYVVRVPFEIVAIDRYAKLTKEQAEILDSVNLRRSYDPIVEGTTLSSAMWKIMQHPDAPQTLREVLPLIGCNAVRDAGGYGIIADKLEIVRKIPVDEHTTIFDIVRQDSKRRRNFISLYPIEKMKKGTLEEVSKMIRKHPYANYPLRFRRFFNNFMMSKTGNDTIDGMNWARDVKLYGIEKVVEKAGLQLPSFSMAKEVFEKYGYAPESSEEEVEKAADEAFRLGYDTGRMVAEEAANHPDIETPEEAYANFEEAYVTSPDYTNFVLPELRRLAKCGDVGSGSFPVCSEESMKRFHVLVNKFWHGVYAGIRDNWQKKKI